MNNKDIYDKLYEVGYHADQQLCHTLRLFPYLENFPRNIRILDVGCSHGLAVKSLQYLGYDAYGIDIASKAIEYCGDRKLVTCILASATDIPFKDKFFDLIISSDTLEHLSEEDIPLMVSEFRRISKLGCLLSIACDEEGGKDHLNMIKYKYPEYANFKALHTCLMTPDQWDEHFLKHFSEVVRISSINFEHIVIYK